MSKCDIVLKWFDWKAKTPVRVVFETKKGRAATYNTLLSLKQRVLQHALLPADDTARVFIRFSNITTLYGLHDADVTLSALNDALQKMPAPKRIHLDVLIDTIEHPVHFPILVNWVRDKDFDGSDLRTKHRFWIGVYCTTTIKDLKMAIQRQEGVLESLQCLIYKGAYLENDDITMDEADISQSCTVHLVLKAVQSRCMDTL